MRARFWSLLLSLGLFLGLALPAMAQSRGGQSLDRILPQVRRNVPGTFYDAEGPYMAPNGQAAYRIKWMTPDGRIIWFNVDARTGQVIGRPSGAGSSGRAPSSGFDGRRQGGDRRNNWQDDDNGWGGGNGWNGGDSRGGGNGWNGGDSRGGGNGWGGDRGGDRRGNNGRGGDSRGDNGRGDNGRGGDSRGSGGRNSGGRGGDGRHGG